MKNRVVVITGSISKGIGEAIARRCVALGAKVMLHGIDEEENRAKELVREFKGNADYVIADFKDIESCKKIIAKTVARFGAIDCLVNNAANMKRVSLQQLSPQVFDEIISVNVKAALFLSQEAIKYFVLQKSGGRILNIGSINAYCGQRDLLPYAMSKAAMMTMTRNLGDTSSLGQDKIYINQLNLGWVSSENEKKLKRLEGVADPNWHEHLPFELAPSGRLLRPDEIAVHAVFWISENAGPITGSIIDLEQFPMTARLNGTQNVFFKNQKSFNPNVSNSSSGDTSIRSKL